jgi:pimeloyl-ACP methyl ester carboxylesterase
LWFGPPGRPLFARSFVPEAGTARAGVVLCPPFGLEAQGAGRAYQVLGRRLESEGFAVLHVDFDGTGDSAGSDGDPGRVQAWQGSVRAAVDLLRAGGAARVCVVGMRLGATVAAHASEGYALDALVLWDPCESGRSYLREEALLRSVYLGDQGLDIPPDPALSEAGGKEILGTAYDAATLKAMTALALESAPGDLAHHVLALFRPERPPRTEMGEAPGQEELISVWPLKSVVPHGTIDTIVSWLSRVIGPESSPIGLPGTSEAALEGPDGGAVVEEIRYLGPNHLLASWPGPPAPGRTPLS